MYGWLSFFFFFFSSRRRHTRFDCDWSSDVCSSDLVGLARSRLARSRDHLAAIAGAAAVPGVRAPRGAGVPRALSRAVGRGRARLAPAIRSWPAGQDLRSRRSRAFHGRRVIRHRANPPALEPAQDPVAEEDVDCVDRSLADEDTEQEFLEIDLQGPAYVT